MRVTDAMLNVVEVVERVVDRVPVILIRRSELDRRARSQVELGLDIAAAGVTRQSMERAEARRRLSVVPN